MFARQPTVSSMPVTWCGRMKAFNVRCVCCGGVPQPWTVQRCRRIHSPIFSLVGQFSGSRFGPVMLSPQPVRKLLTLLPFLLPLPHVAAACFHTGHLPAA
jgi:hypothetical protein